MKEPLSELMKQAQKVQEQMKQVQDQIARAEIAGESGAGLVKVLATGKHFIKRVEIDPSLLTEDKAILEDLIAAAINDAVRKVDEFNQTKVASLTAGINLPMGFNIPF